MYNNIKLWDKSLKQIQQKEQAHDVAISCITANESFIITGSLDLSLKKWDIFLNELKHKENTHSAEEIRN